MAVPEASMNEDHAVVLRQYDVGGSGKVLSMQPESESAAMECAPDELLGLGVLASNLRHDGASLRGGEYVGHF